MRVSFARARDLRIIKARGGGKKAWLQRRNSLNAVPLGLYGAVLAGATSITVAGGKLSGFVSEGSKLTVAGVAGIYTATADATATAGRVIVALTPPLAGPAADGALVTFTQPYGEFWFYRMFGSQEEEFKDQIADGTKITVLAWRPGVPAPDKDNSLDGKPVTKVESVNSGSGTTRYRLTLAGFP